MSYCHATTSNAQTLAHKTGLNVVVALAWLWNECQTNNNPTNPLNIRWYGSRTQVGQKGGTPGKVGTGFAVYKTPTAGMEDAAWLINNSQYYSGIRNAAKSGNIWAQARAIELSPWAGGHYGGAKGPGGISRKLALITGKPIASVSQAVDSTKEGASNPAATVAPKADMLPGFSYLVSFPTGHILTTADVDTIMAATDKAGWWDQLGGGTSYDIMKGILLQEVGKPWNKDMQDRIQGKVNMAAGLAGQIGPNAITALASVVPDIPGAIGSFGGVVVKSITYVLAVVLLLAGLWLYSKGRSAPAMEAPLGEG